MTRGFVTAALFAAGFAVVAAGVPAQAQSMDDAWQSVLRRWVGNGWKPFHEGGYNFTADGNQGRRWGAGLRAGEAVTFGAVCSNCDGVQLILRDGRGNILATANAQRPSSSLSHTPRESSNGTIQLIPVGCRQPACPVRYTSFLRR
jgi:hypothetical protein